MWLRRKYGDINKSHTFALKFLSRHFFKRSKRGLATDILKHPLDKMLINIIIYINEL